MQLLLLGGAGTVLKASKPVTPHWGNVVVVERWWCHVEAPAFEHDYTIGKFVNHGVYILSAELRITS